MGTLSSKYREPFQMKIYFMNQYQFQLNMNFYT